MKDNEKILKVHRVFKELRDRRVASGWDANAQTGIKFLFGDQWPQDIKSKLNNQGRAALTFNLFVPIVDALIGHMLDSRSDVVAIPVDRSADPYIAKFLTAGIKHIEQTNEVAYERKAQFIDGLMTGVGIKEKWFDTDTDISGRIRCEQRPSWEYYLHSNFRKQNYSDAKVLVHELWLDEDEIRKIYGKKIADQLEIPDDERDSESNLEVIVSDKYNQRTDFGQAGGKTSGGLFSDNLLTGNYDTKGKLFRVVELFEKVYEEREYVLNPETGDPIELDSLAPDEREMVKDLAITRSVSKIHLTTAIGNVLAEDKDTDASEFYQLFDFYFPYFMNGYFMGAVQHLIDPQMEVNKRYSTIVHILTSLANSGIYYKKDAFDSNTRANLSNLLAQSGSAIPILEMYDEHGRPNVVDRKAQQVPAELNYMIEKTEDFAKYISGAIEPISGDVQRKQSGAAKRTDLAQASSRLNSNMIDNFRYTIQFEAKSYIWYIKTYKNEEWMFRVYGDSMGDMPEEITLNKQAMGQIFNDITVGEYDVVMVFEGMSPTERDATFWKITEMTKMAPQYAPAFLPLQIDLMPISEKNAVKRNIAMIQQQQQQMQAAQMTGGGQRGTIQSAPRPQRGASRMPQKVQSTG